MPFTPEQRSFLLDGPAENERKRYPFDGPCQLRVAWSKNRDELMASCPDGRRPFGYWMVERRLKQKPPGELGQLRAIRTLNLYRSDAERRYVLRRIAEIAQGMHSRRQHLHAVA